MLGFPLLTVIVFVPAGGALLVGLTPSGRVGVARALAALTALVEIALVVACIVEFKVEAGFQFMSAHSWISALGIQWKVGVDGISVFLLAMTSLLCPVARCGPKVASQARSFLAWMLLLEAACVTAFLALDLFLFFVAFELTLVPAYFLISGWGGARRSFAAMKFFIYTFAGSAFLLVGILAVALLVSAHTGHPVTFDLISLTRAASSLPVNDQYLIFAAFAVAFAVKVPLIPFHSWLPDAYTEAPTGGSMILAGILFKLGAYGLLRFGVFLLPRAANGMAPVLLTLAVVGITYGGVITIMQRDLKRLIAYASIADVGFVVLGVFAFSPQGITGGVLEMVNHGLTTGALFFLVGMVWERRQSFRFSDLGGIQKSSPVLAGVFLVVVLAAVGLPGLNGFVGEVLVLVGPFITHRWWAVVATSGIVLGAIYMLWAYQRVFHGQLVQAPATDAKADISWRELAAITPLLAGIVFLGIYPKPLLDRVEPSVSHLLAHVEHVDRGLQMPAEAGVAGNPSVPVSQNVDSSTVFGFQTAASVQP
ncbi:MAG: complex I subunit 4 family protein [Acidimicrobiales bacterium]